jgi:glycerol kinase
MAGKYILAIDQGTSSTKALIFDGAGQALAKGTEWLFTNYLDHGFVEQDGEAIFQNVLAAVSKCLAEFSRLGFNQSEIGGIGISNQRETFLVWDEHGRPLHPAIVWQCKRSVKICESLKQKGLEPKVRERTGLMLDPYFSATKLIWLAEHNEVVKHAISSGAARFGTIDTWLLYKLTGGQVYATDYTNASRTLMFNLQTLAWDNDLIEDYGLTGIQLPDIRPSSYGFGHTTLEGLLDQPVAVAALAGDSHAAAFGEGCFDAGTAKATLGTGCSILMNIGEKPLASQHGMVTTVAWSVEGRLDYALEGVIVSCGATIEWLKNTLKLFAHSKETAAMANAVPDNGGVCLVPAFSGLGSPHWQMDRRATLSGLTFGTTSNHIVRAALESIPYQIMDVIVAMEKDSGVSLKELMTDGGITANGFVMQFIADLLKKNTVTIGMPDVSALGAAYLAGLETGLYESIENLKNLNAEKRYYVPGAGSSAAANGYQQWQQAIQAGQ